MHKIYINQALSVDVKRLISHEKYKYFKFGFKIDIFKKEEIKFAIDLIEKYYSQGDFIIESVELFKRPSFTLVRDREPSTTELERVQNEIDKLLSLLNVEPEVYFINDEVDPPISYYILPSIWKITNHAIVCNSKIFTWEKFNYDKDLFYLSKSGVEKYIAEQFKSNIVMDLIPFYSKYVEKDYSFSLLQKSHIKQILIYVMRHASQNYWTKNIKQLFEYMKSELSCFDDLSLILHSINLVSIDFLNLVSFIREDIGTNVSFYLNQNTEDHMIFQVKTGKVLIIFDTNDLGSVQLFKDSSTRKISTCKQDVDIENISEGFRICQTFYFDRLTINWSKSELNFSEDNQLWFIKNPISIRGRTNLAGGSLETVKADYEGDASKGFCMVAFRFEDIISGAFNTPFDKITTEENQIIDYSNYEKLISLMPDESSLFLNWSSNEKYREILECVNPNLKLSVSIKLPFDIWVSSSAEEAKETFTWNISDILSSKNLEKLEIYHTEE